MFFVLETPQSTDYDDDECTAYSVYFGTTKFISPSSTSFSPSQEMTLRERGKLPVTIDLRGLPYVTSEQKEWQGIKRYHRQKLYILRTMRGQETKKIINSCGRHTWELPKLRANCAARRAMEISAFRQSFIKEHFSRQMFLLPS